MRSLLILVISAWMLVSCSEREFSSTTFYNQKPQPSPILKDTFQRRYLLHAGKDFVNGSTVVTRMQDSLSIEILYLNQRDTCLFFYGDTLSCAGGNYIQECRGWVPNSSIFPISEFFDCTLYFNRRDDLLGVYLVGGDKELLLTNKLESYEYDLQCIFQWHQTTEHLHN